MRKQSFINNLIQSTINDKIIKHKLNQLNKMQEWKSVTYTITYKNQSCFEEMGDKNKE